MAIDMTPPSTVPSAGADPDEPVTQVPAFPSPTPIERRLFAREVLMQLVGSGRALTPLASVKLAWQITDEWFKR